MTGRSSFVAPDIAETPGLPLEQVVEDARENHAENDCARDDHEPNHLAPVLSVEPGVHGFASLSHFKHRGDRGGQQRAKLRRQVRFLSTGCRATRSVVACFIRDLRVAGSILRARIFGGNAKSRSGGSPMRE